ncbi:uncharacterized protein V1518DRAFT_422019 [Limtongia smithiae]|uniref:uncharacterized protein n=1 Tax=Limtongia smithiae TaxID=1125753 RepID=UPI0034CE1A21
MSSATPRRLFRLLLSESRYFFDAQTRIHIAKRVRAAFDGNRKKTTPEHEAHLIRRARRALRRLRRANAGDFTACVGLLQHAWMQKGVLRHQELLRLVQHTQIDAFPVPVHLCPWLIRDTAPLSESTFTALLALHFESPDCELHTIILGEADIFYDLHKLAVRSTSPFAAYASHVLLDISPRFLNPGISAPPHTPLPLVRPRYSGPLRALLEHAKLSPYPQFPPPPLLSTAKQVRLSVRRSNNIEKRHFKKLLSKVPVPVPQAWVDTIRPFFARERYTDTVGNQRLGYSATPRFVHEASFRLRRGVYDKKKFVFRDIYVPRVGYSRAEAARRGIVPARSLKAQFFRNCYMALLKNVPVLQKRDNGFWSAQTIVLEKKMPAVLHEWML